MCGSLFTGYCRSATISGGWYSTSKDHLFWGLLLSVLERQALLNDRVDEWIIQSHRIPHIMLFQPGIILYVLKILSKLSAVVRIWAFSFPTFFADFLCRRCFKTSKRHRKTSLSLTVLISKSFGFIPLYLSRNLLRCRFFLPSENTCPPPRSPAP